MHLLDRYMFRFFIRLTNFKIFSLDTDYAKWESFMQPRLFNLMKADMSRNMYLSSDHISVH